MKKRNYIGAAECRIWMRETYVGKDASDLSREDLEASDASIAKRFNLTHAAVGNIRRELGIYTARDRMYIAHNIRPKGVEVAPEQEPAKPVRPAYPEWVKEGAWVIASSDITGERFLGEIVEVCKEAFHIHLREKEFVFSYSQEETCYVSPVRFRPYTFDEAGKLIGKVLKYNDKLELIVKVEDRDGEAFLNGCNQWWWSNLHAEIDGLPFGVPEIDYEACRAKTPEA